MDKHVLIGIGIGAGAVVVVPYLAPLGVAITRPLFKAALKQGVLAYARLRELVAEAAEGLEDLVAEVRAEADDAIARRDEAAKAPRAQAA